MDLPLVSLPLDILAHIQSFMNFKDAARSAVVSTHLLETWRFQKIIDFDQGAFTDGLQFWIGVKRTLQRYADAGRTVDRVTFRIHESFQLYIPTAKCVEFAVSLGAVDINVFLLDGNFYFIIPDLVFTSERVQRLSVIGGCLNVAHEIPLVCNTMKSMVLRPVHFLGYRSDLMSNYVLRCPNLENLECHGFMLWYSFTRFHDRSHNLSSLTVDGMHRQDDLFFDESIQCLPCLKFLNIYGVRTRVALRISSQSIQYLVIRDRYRSIHAHIDVPNLRTFHIECSATSLIQFKSPMECHAIDVSVFCFKSDDEWFASLYRLMQSIPRSRLKLAVNVVYDNNVFSCDFNPYVPPIRLDELCVRVASPEPELLIGLFRLCVPTLFRYYDDDGNDLTFPHGFLMAPAVDEGG